MCCSNMNHNVYGPPSRVSGICDAAISREPLYSKWSYFQRTRADTTRLLQETWPTAVWLLPRRAQWLVLGQQSVTFAVFKKFSLKSQKAEKKCQADGCLGGFVCGGLSIRGGLLSKPHWSNGWSESYPPSMWTQPSPSNTHGPAQWATFIQQCFSWSPLFCSSTALYHGAFASAFNLCSCLFIRSTLNRPLESSTCFSSLTIAKAVVSVKFPHKYDETQWIENNSFFL